MHLTVTWNAQQPYVVRVVAECFGFLDCRRTLEGHDMVAVNPRNNQPVCEAFLTEPVGTRVHDFLYLSPSLVVKHPLVLRSVSALAHSLLPFYIERSPRQTLQIVERFVVGLGFRYRLLLLGQSVVLFVYHFDLVLVVGNLRRWTPLTFSIDTSLPSSKDALNVMNSLLNSAIIKPFSLRKIFLLVVVIESIILNVCW